MAYGATATDARSRPAQQGNVETILGTLRALESGQGNPSGDYTSSSRISSASGAYQYLDSTWNGYGGYRRAKDAPPSVQDARARQDVTNILQAHNGDVSAVPWNWYYPASNGNRNVVPPGNTLSVGQYVDQWMRIYNSLGGGGNGASYGPGNDQAPIVPGDKKAVDKWAAVSKYLPTGRDECIIGELTMPGPIPNIPCLMSTNKARAIGGAALLGVGGILVLSGVFLLVGKSVPAVAQYIPGVPSRPDPGDVLYERTKNDPRPEPPMTSAGNKTFVGRSVDPFPE